MPLDNPQELFYWVDDQDQVLGTITRGEAHSDPNKIHRSVHIIITNSAGQMLFQKRSMKKDKDPGKWTISASGHVTYPDNYEQTAVKELQEELGIQTELQFFKKMLMRGSDEVEFNVIYTGKYEELPTNFDKDEVDGVKWVSKEEIQEKFRTNQLTLMAVGTLKELGYL